MSTCPKTGLDPAVASVLDTNRHDLDNSDEDSDALFAELEEANETGDPTLSNLREQRLEQLRSEILKSRVAKDQGSGSYIKVKDEKEVMDLTTSQKLVVVHFAHPDFGRCLVMERHLEALAKRHFDTRFIGVNVEDAPFLVTKLSVRVLPCVLSFVDGNTVDRIIGFEGLGVGDKFTTKDLETRLLTAGVLSRQRLTDDDDGPDIGSEDTQTRTKIIRGPQRKINIGDDNDDDEDDDWD